MLTVQAAVLDLVPHLMAVRVPVRCRLPRCEDRGVYLTLATRPRGPNGERALAECLRTLAPVVTLCEVDHG